MRVVDGQYKTEHFKTYLMITEVVFQQECPKLNDQLFSMFSNLVSSKNINKISSQYLN